MIRFILCRLGKFVPHKGRLSSSKQTPLIWEPWPHTGDQKGRETIRCLQVYHNIQLEKHTALILLSLIWIDFTSIFSKCHELAVDVIWFYMWWPHHSHELGLVVTLVISRINVDMVTPCYTVFRLFYTTVDNCSTPRTTFCKQLCGRCGRQGPCRHDASQSKRKIKSIVHDDPVRYSLEINRICSYSLQVTASESILSELSMHWH